MIFASMRNLPTSHRTMCVILSRDCQYIARATSAARHAQIRKRVVNGVEMSSKRS